MLLRQVSPVAWQHINFYGRYEFIKGPAPIDVDVMVQELAQQSLVPAEDEAWVHLFEGLCKNSHIGGRAAARSAASIYRLVDATR